MNRLKILVIIFLTVSYSCRNEKHEVKSSFITPVTIEVVSGKKVSIPVNSTGVLLLSDEMKLSFKTGGIVQKINVKEGEKVKKGTVLAALNLSEINAQVNLARNGYEKASRDFERAKNLYADSVATLEQLQNAKTALNVASSNLEIARFNLSHSTITAPDAGVILKKFVRENELVSAGYPVFLFGSSGKSWRVKTGLSDRDIVKVNPGDSAVVLFDAWPGVRFPAVVDVVGRMANQLTGTFDAELRLGDLGYMLAAGFVASVEIYPAASQSFLLVPVSSIIEADGQSGYIFVLTDSSDVKKIKVNIVTITGSMAAVQSPEPGIERVVTGGAAYLRDGEKVKVVK